MIFGEITTKVKYNGKMKITTFFLLLFLVFSQCFSLFFCENSFAGEIPEDQTVGSESLEAGRHPTGDINHSEDISVFRDKYLPVEYYPESFDWRVADIIALGFLLFIGSALVFHKRARKNLRIFAFIALLYFGIIRGGCICPVGSVGNLIIGIKYPEAAGVYVALLFLLPMIAALVSGRVFCSAACPIGAVQNFFTKNNALKLPRKILFLSRMIPVIILVLLIFAALKNAFFLICSLDPYKPLFFAGTSVVAEISSVLTGKFSESGISWASGIYDWLIFFTVIIIGYWFPKPFCRLLCPYGAVLGLISLISLRQRTLPEDKCNLCRACEKKCPVQAIQSNKKTEKIQISAYNCIQCGLCSELCKTK
jgi:polyferredoxin